MHVVIEKKKSNACRNRKLDLLNLHMRTSCIAPITASMHPTGNQGGDFMCKPLAHIKGIEENK